MPVEARMEQLAAALLVGEVTDPLVAPLQRAQAAGWCFNQLPDIYAAAANLLRPDKPKPVAVVVLVESLRGDELRFFDFLARGMPRVPAVAVYAASAEDRRLEACRRRRVTVLSAADLGDWLAKQRRAEAPQEEPAPGTAGGQAASEAAIEPLPLPVTPLIPAQDEPAAPKAPQAGSDPASALSGVEVELDLPDELADLPDLDEMQAELAAPTEYSDDDLPALPEESDIYIEPLEPDLDEPDEDELPAEDEDEDGEPEEEDLPGRVPLTPWSSQPRVDRRPPRRPPQARAPAGGQEPAVVLPEQGVAPAPVIPETRNPRPISRPLPAPNWEHGLLTPEELRALLQDPDEPAGPGEARP